MSYATYDFEESLQRVAIDPRAIDAVVAAWGYGDGQGQDAGHSKWAEDGVTDWSGGFLLQLMNGRYAYLSGWCDYTGWGCQDGAQVEYFDTRPPISALKGEYENEPPEAEWDFEPADLNRWLAGAKDTPLKSGG